MTNIITQRILTDDLKAIIYKGFAKHSIVNTGIDGVKDEPIAFVIESSEFKAAIVVQLFWGQLHIKLLLVEEKYRNQGIGKELLDHALKYGKSKGV